MKRIEDIGERGLLELIQRWCGGADSSVEIGIGDDAAVMSWTPEQGFLVATVDLMEEGVDFDRQYCPLRLVGRKAAAMNLSDLAAMGARPSFLLLGLSLPRQTAIDDVECLVRGIVERAGEQGARVVGGDLCAPPKDSERISMAVTALGSMDGHPPGRRSGARAGDLICVTGTLGDSALGMELLRSGRVDLKGPFEGPRSSEEWLAYRHLSPEPRCAEGRELVGLGVSTLIDVSDGLVRDLGHLLSHSGVGGVIDLEKLPRSEAFAAMAASESENLLLGGGEDYELLFAVSPEHLPSVKERLRNVRVTAIGEFVHEQTLVIHGRNGEIDPLSCGGWDHFQR